MSPTMLSALVLACVLLNESYADTGVSINFAQFQLVFAFVFDLPDILQFQSYCALKNPSLSRSFDILSYKDSLFFHLQYTTMVSTSVSSNMSVIIIVLQTTFRFAKIMKIFFNSVILVYQMQPIRTFSNKNVAGRLITTVRQRIVKVTFVWVNCLESRGQDVMKSIGFI